MKFNLLLEKYHFIKTFKTPITYEETPIDEVASLLMVDSRLKEVERLCMELNNNAK